jgi:hypothetical protein
MVIRKGLLKKKGKRTDVVPGELGPQYGLEQGTSLVKQIRMQQEAKRQQASRAARRERRAKRKG